MSAPITLAAKDPNERLGYTWTPSEGDTISGTPTVVVSEGTATIDGSVTKINDDAALRFFLIGGTDGETTIITARATMASGDIIEQTILIPIRDSASSRAEVSLAMAKQHLRVRHSDEDSLIEGYVSAARAWIERYTRLVVYPRTVIDSFTAFGDYLTLTRGPVIELTSVAYVDADGDDQTVADVRLRDGRIYPPVAGWPTIEAYSTIRVTYEAGYGVSDDYPIELTQAQLLLIGHWYENRSAVDSGNVIPREIPLSVETLAGPFRLPTIA